MLAVEPVAESSSAAPVCRFCPRCGKRLEPASIECADCVGKPIGSNLSERYQTDLQSLRSAMWLYFALLSFSGVLLAWHAVNEGKPSLREETKIGLAFAGLVLAWSTRSFSTLRPLFTTRFHASWLLIAVFVAFATFFLASGAVHLLHRYCGVERLDYLGPYSGNPAGLAWAVLNICIQPAVFEEIAFRGMILGSLLHLLEQRDAIMVSGLMFAILHLSVPSLPHLLVLGLVLGWLRARTKSLFPGMALHFTHNFLVLFSEQTGRLLPW
jgi:membrane protease YdiL (CAAX protease family)